MFTNKKVKARVQFMNVGGFAGERPSAPPSSGRRRRPQCSAGRVPATPATCRAYEYEAL